jgi:hypothetical protein
MLEPTDDDLFDCIEKLFPMILLLSELLLRSGSAVESSSKMK